MKHIKKSISTYSLVSVLLMITACEKNPDIQKNRSTARGEYIYRTSDEFPYRISAPHHQAPPNYSWIANHDSTLPPITKAHFRCRGNSGHVPKKIEIRDEIRYVNDCNGALDHSLPIRDGEEYIYPILIDLLNYVQNNTQKRVQITSGHRCQNHHDYIDSLLEHQTSKHLIGAEATFYVEGFEETPDTIINLLQNYYLQTEYYKNQNEYQVFQRWQGEIRDITTPPWYNKEIFIKLYKKNEGRNLDNDHPYPYISLQVRYDKEKKDKVNYSWDQSHKGYYRY